MDWSKMEYYFLLLGFLYKKMGGGAGESKDFLFTK